MKIDETHVAFVVFTSATLCGFYLRGSLRLNLLPRFTLFFNAEERKEKKAQRTAKEYGI